MAAPLKLRRPIDIKVRGTLFPCALLSSGWWERRKESKVRRLQWRDGLQEWLFHGFDLWGPSWDFTWGEGSEARPYRAGPDYLNRISASISGGPAGVRLPRGIAAG
jgi:hypothetical protein